MRATPVLLAIVAALAAGCASDPPDTGPDLGALADQAERVGQLAEEDRPCEAAEAARTLATLAERDDLELEVRQAVISFANSAEASVTCDPGVTPTDASPSDTEGAGGDQDDDQQGGDQDGDGQDDEDEGQGEGQGQGEGEGDDKPGRGHGRDNGNGNGNGDD